MGRRSSETSPEIRGAIVALHYKGLSNGAVAQCTGVSKVTVARWIKRYKATGTTIDQPRSGRPRCTRKQEGASRAPRRRPHRQHGPGLGGKWQLSEDDMEGRMEYALERADEPCSFWESVVFCSEKALCYSSAANKVCCRTRCESNDMDGTQNNGQICACMFGWMHASGVGELVDVGQESFTGDKYVELLEEVLLPAVRAKLFPGAKPFYLVQDKSPIHSSDAVKRWFEGHPEITLLPLPSKSPDIDPMEDIWEMMTQNLELDNPDLHSRATMMERVKLAWEELRSRGGQDMTVELVASMPRRLNSVIDAGGAYAE